MRSLESVKAVLTKLIHCKKCFNFDVRQMFGAAELSYQPPPPLFFFMTHSYHNLLYEQYSEFKKKQKTVSFPSL